MKRDKHIETILKSASKVIGITRKLKYNFTRKKNIESHILIYVSPFFEY